MKRTNIVIDDELVRDLMKSTGIKTQRELVDHALRRLANIEGQKKILELKGKYRWEGNLDEMRAMH